MNKVLFAILFLAATTLTAQSGAKTQGVLKVKSDQSSIAWKADKVTGSHSGTVNIKEGTLNIKDGFLTGGNFVIDMTSIAVTDLQDKGKASLEGHLKSEDFFGVEKFPTATLTVLRAKSKGKGVYDVTGDLTIKGITHPVNFTTTLEQGAKEVKATSDIKIDRTLYDVKYGSGKFFEDLGDKTIYDEFNLHVTLVAAE